MGDLPPDAQLAVATRPIARASLVVLTALVVGVLVVGVLVFSLLRTVKDAVDPHGCLSRRSAAGAAQLVATLENDNHRIHGLPTVPVPTTVACRR